MTIKSAKAIVLIIMSTIFLYNLCSCAANVPDTTSDVITTETSTETEAVTTEEETEEAEMKLKENITFEQSE